MSFDTDKPVREVRLLVDGKQVGFESFQTSAKTLKLAVITSPSSKEPMVEVHMEVDHMGRFMKGAYRVRHEANVLQSEYFGPGTNVVLKEWTQVYGLTQLMGVMPLYELRVEVR
jgi:hypothetical protein